MLPGFGLSLGYTVAYLSLIVLIPLSAVFLKTATLGFDAVLERRHRRRAWSPATSSASAPRCSRRALNSVFGLMLAWSLVRYSFPGRKIVDALVDLPFALPTAVAGIALTALYAGNGWLGSLLEPLGVKVAFTPLGILVALTFIGLPFVVRTVQPVLEDLDTELEEAAASLGAHRWQTFRHVVLPILAPALLTGFALAFARAVGEYGSVIFIAGNLPMVSEITPLMIITKLEQYDYAGATAIATVMLVLSFTLLLAINGLQAWAAKTPRRRRGQETLMAGAAASLAARPARQRTPRRFEANPATREAPWVRRTVLALGARLLRAVPAHAAGGRLLRGAAGRAGTPTSPRWSSPTRCRRCG